MAYLDKNGLNYYSQKVSGKIQDVQDELNEQISSLQTELSTKANSSNLAMVATSGSYDDLSNKPDIVNNEDFIQISEIFLHENLLFVNDINDRFSTSLTVSRNSATNEITLTNGSSSKWICVQTPDTWVQSNLTIGKKYRFWAKYEVVAGTPANNIGVRGTNGEPNRMAATIKFVDSDEGYVDFVVDEYMKRITLFVSFDTNTNGSAIKYQVWLKEISTTAIDKESRKSINILNNNVYSLTTGIEIPENSDLNNYTDVGTYYSGATTPLSIDNHPNTTYPFKLFVEDIHTDVTQSYNVKSIRQTIVYDCSPVLVYQRQGTVVDNQKTFGNWQLDSITKVSDLTNDSNFTTKTYVDGEIDSLQTTISTKADIDGSYDSMAVKESERLASLDFTEDNTPYLFRKSGGDGNEEPVIVGGSVVWNQLVQNGNFADGTNNWQYSSSVGTSSFTVTDGVAHIVGTKPRISQSFGHKTGHRYFIGCSMKASVAASYKLGFATTSSGGTDVRGCNILAGQENTWKRFEYIYTNSVKAWIYVGLYNNQSALPQEGTLDVKDIVFIDLTAMFGTTIADYVYGLETATEGTGIAWLKKYGFFTKDYYEYCDPTIKSVSGLVSHNMTGFNQWDEQWEVGGISSVSGANMAASDIIRSKNYIPVKDGETYYFNSNTKIYAIFLYDFNKQFIQNVNIGGVTTTYKMPSNCCYIRFRCYASYGASYKNDLCINFNKTTGSPQNGDYVPYDRHTYALDSDLTLRGILRLDAGNNLYYDGDVYSADGTVGRKYGVHAFTGTESLTMIATGTEGWSQFAYNPSPAAVSGSGVYDKSDVARTIAYSSFDTNNVTERLVTHYGNGIRFVLPYTSVADAKTELTGKTLVYKLATPTTETADPFQSPQVVDSFGTEEWVFDDNAFPIPVGHETTYRNIVTMQDVKDIQSNIDNIQFNLNNKQDTLTFDSTPTADSLNPVTSGGIKTALDNKETAISNVEVSGTSPVIVAESNTIYNCGEVTSLSFTPCSSGICDVRFTSGSTVTVLTIPSTVKFPNSFDPTSLETNKIYEINILDGIYGVVTSWAI